MKANELKFILSEGEGQFIKSASVVCAVYQGDDKVQILDRKIFNDGLVGNINAAVTYVKRHMDVRFEIHSVQREEIPQYPEAAFREAIVNAVMHRDYFDISGDVMVEIFDNRVTISNPGGLVTWLPPEDFGKYSRTRNRLIASLLMRTPQAEKMGTGIRRIQQALKTAGNPPAKFDYDDYNFSITLFSAPHAEQAGTLNGTLNEKIYEMIRHHPGIQRKDLIEQTGASVRTVAREVSELLSGGRIERRGSKKTGGYWAL
jgi:ATP-dependent DNA helicase RecG